MRTHQLRDRDFGAASEDVARRPPDPLTPLECRKGVPAGDTVWRSANRHTLARSNAREAALARPPTSEAARLGGSLWLSSSLRGPARSV